jgi:hypothetical protein
MYSNYYNILLLIKHFTIFAAFKLFSGERGTCLVVVYMTNTSDMLTWVFFLLMKANLKKLKHFRAFAAYFGTLENPQLWSWSLKLSLSTNLSANFYLLIISFKNHYSLEFTHSKCWRAWKAWKIIYVILERSLAFHNMNKFIKTARFFWLFFGLRNK